MCCKRLAGNTGGKNDAKNRHLTAEIDWPVWGTPSYVNWYRVLAALLHGSQVVGVSRTLRR